jgi:sulfonate transport system substrate-binding protein
MPIAQASFDFARRWLAALRTRQEFPRPERSAKRVVEGRAIAVALFALLAFAASARAAEPVHIRIGWVVVPSDLAPLMFAKPGMAPHAGKTYVPELIHFSGTATIVTALASDQLDMAAIAYSTFAIAIENAGLQDLRVIMDSFMDGVGSYHTNDYMVRNDSPIRNAEGLKGKVLATNEAGSAIDMSLRAMLRKHGLDPARDVNIIEVKFPDMKAMLRDRKVDLIAAASPYDYDPELRSFARTLFTQKDGMGPTEMIMRVARTPFIAAHRAALIDFAEDYLRLLHFLYDPANRAEAVSLVADATKQKPALFEDWVFTGKDYYRNPDAKPDLDVLQANIETQRRLGFLKSDLEVRKYADLSLVEEAAKRLKQ